MIAQARVLFPLKLMSCSTGTLSSWSHKLVCLAFVTPEMALEYHAGAEGSCRHAKTSTVVFFIPWALLGRHPPILPGGCPTRRLNGGILLFALLYLGTLQFALFYFDFSFLPHFTLLIYYLPCNSLDPRLKTIMPPVHVRAGWSWACTQTRFPILCCFPTGPRYATPWVRPWKRRVAGVKPRFHPRTRLLFISFPESLLTHAGCLHFLRGVPSTILPYSWRTLVPLTSFLVGQPPPSMLCSAAATAVHAWIGRRLPWLVWRAPKLHLSSPSLCLS
jgi:hypothetical protein